MNREEDIHGDALTNFKIASSESIDLIFADPPYNIGKDFTWVWWNLRRSVAAFSTPPGECIDECHRVLEETRHHVHRE